MLTVYYLQFEILVQSHIALVIIFFNGWTHHLYFFKVFTVSKLAGYRPKRGRHTSSSRYSMPTTLGRSRKKAKELSNADRLALLQDFLRESTNGRATPATIRKFADIYGVGARTAKRVYNKSEAATGGKIKCVDDARKAKCGRRLQAAQSAWDNINFETLLNNWRTFGLVLIEILAHAGDNVF